ncbi:Spo0E family sporulation regulatory protein-aspartic acid phosphatase [Alkaliphilus hydrothermalis]|uniref:Spo0E family sporulation regulatory protein-aspartic acid phosphatase n=1 Tax=Alkaliphilus hydrothermalis TaxID=1482730 RepID=UPI0038CC10C6
MRIKGVLSKEKDKKSLIELPIIINGLRKKMHIAIDQKGNLINPEVINISQMCVDALNQYNLSIIPLKS